MSSNNRILFECHIRFSGQPYGTLHITTPDYECHAPIATQRWQVYPHAHGVRQQHILKNSFTATRLQYYTNWERFMYHTINKGLPDSPAYYRLILLRCIKYTASLRTPYRPTNSRPSGHIKEKIKNNISPSGSEHTLVVDGTVCYLCSFR